MSIQKQTLFSSLLAFGFVVADQLTKYYAVTRLRTVFSVEVIHGFFSLSYVENRGAAWGVLQGQQIFLIGFSLLTLAWMIWKARKVFFPLLNGPLVFSLLSGGIVGNLIDRVFRGRVIDFLDFYWGTSHFPAFNVADACICVGVFLYIVGQWYRELLAKYKSPMDEVDRLHATRS